MSSNIQQQQQIILRLPEDLAIRVRSLIKEGMKAENAKTPFIVEVKPEDPSMPSNDFIFFLDGVEYPALLSNIPTPLESHKTFDNKIFLKSGDIGQMLQVFLSDKDREIARSKIFKTPYGEYAPNGITPPTHDIVKRRYELTRKNDIYLPYKIRQVIHEINSPHIDFWNPTATSGVTLANYDPLTGTTSAPVKGSRGKKKSSSNLVGTAGAENTPAEERKDVVCEFVEEEVVDYQPWMSDPSNPAQGISVTLGGKDWEPSTLLIQQHPEMLHSVIDEEEDHYEALFIQQQLEDKQQEAKAQQHIQQKIRTLSMAVSASSNKLDTMTVEESPAEDESLKLSFKVSHSLEEKGGDRVSYNEMMGTSGAEEDRNMVADDDAGQDDNDDEDENDSEYEENNAEPAKHVERASENEMEVGDVVEESEQEQNDKEESDDDAWLDNV